MQFFVYACPCVDASESFQTGRRLLYDRREAGLHWFHRYLKEAKTDSKVLQTGFREFQKGDVPDGQQHPGI